MLQKEGVDLYSVLLLSETSRRALRFYHPERIPAGIVVRISTLGSALSLVADLRWYVRRYMREVFFEGISGDLLHSRAGATGVLRPKRKSSCRPGRTGGLTRYGDNEIIEDRAMSAGEDRVPVADTTVSGMEIWCSAEEFEEL